MLRCLLGMALGVFPAQGQEKGFPGRNGPSPGILEVDPGSGAASLYLPLGPGIGRPGFRFVPALVGRFAPAVGPAPGTVPAVPDGFELSPGSLDLPLAGEGPRPGIRWTYPDGSGGGAGAPLPAAVDLAAILSGFGYEPSADPGQLPRLDGAVPVPFGFQGTGGDCLVALREETRIEDRWIIPTRLVAVRGELAYEYQFAWIVPGYAQYRLAAIRSRAGEVMTFTYGANGVDFEAAWEAERIRVALDGMVPTAPVPALDPAPADPGAGAPDPAFRDAEAQLRITCEGSGAPTAFAVRALAPPEAPRSEGPGALARRQGSWLRSLQVTRVQDQTSGAETRFGYGKATAGIPPSAPTVLQAIAWPDRRIELEWEGRPWEGDGEETGAGVAQGEIWRFGVAAVHDRDGEGQGASYRRAAPGTESQDPPAPAGGASWVRQSRHFALGQATRDGGKCHTQVRDRWELGPARAASEDAADPQLRIPYDDEGDIPTFAFDPQTKTLVPVPGQLTRWLNWKAEDRDRAPDLHWAGHPGASGGTGLKGGGLQPPARPGGIIYDPNKHEATMEAVSGPAPAGGGSVRYGPLGPGGQAVDRMTEEVARVQRLNQEISQRAAATQASQQAATDAAQAAMKAQEARQQATFAAMDQRAKAQQAEAQARMTRQVEAQAQAQVQAQAQMTQQAKAPVEKFSARAILPSEAELQMRLKQAAAGEEEWRILQEAFKTPLAVKQLPPLGRSGANHPNEEGITILQSISTTMLGKPGDVMVMIWDWQGAGVVGKEHSVGHAALALKDIKGAWRIVQSQFPHEPGGGSRLVGPNILISRPSVLRQEEGGRKPDTAFLVNAPDLGALATAAIADLCKPWWYFDPGNSIGSTNCTHGIVHSLRAGGVPLTGMWANQTLIIPGTPYTPRDLRTALDRDTPFNVIHPYKIYHRNDMIDQINWED